MPYTKTNSTCCQLSDTLCNQSAMKVYMRSCIPMLNITNTKTKFRKSNSVLKAHHRLLAAVGCSTRRRHGKGQTYNAFEPQTSSYTSHTGLDSFDLSHAQQRYVHISWYNSREYNSISFTLTTHCLLKKTNCYIFHSKLTGPIFNCHNEWKV